MIRMMTSVVDFSTGKREEKAVEEKRRDRAEAGTDRKNLVYQTRLPVVRLGDMPLSS